jgi:hypothetical protein
VVCDRESIDGEVSNIERLVGVSEGTGTVDGMNRLTVRAKLHDTLRCTGEAVRDGVAV